MAKTSPLNDDQSDYESSCSSITVPESSRSWMSNLSFGSRRSSISLCSEICPSNQFKPHKANQVAYEAMKLLQREKGGRISLEHFKLLRRVGSGDIGHVYLCQIRNPVVGLPQSFYAMKVVDREALAIRKKLQRADMEKEILGMVDHPFLPTLYATFDASHYSCLVMEFCPGGDLHATRLRQPSKHFTVSSARFYGAETLLALEYLHMMGIVYRDLKPENVLMREDGHIMLSDFDLSLICDVVPRLVKSKVEYAQETVEKNGGKCITPACSLPIQPVLSCFSYSKKTKSKIVTTITENANGEIGKKELNNNNGFQEHHVRDVSSRVSDAGTGLGILSPDAKSRPGPDFHRFRAYSTELVAEPVNARSKSFVGTHEYLAPEVISGQGHGSAVDWWTFGVFLYELIYGKTPFRGENNEKTLINILKQPLTFPRVVMSSTKEYEELLKVQDLISKLLVKNPKKRIGSLRGSVEIKRHEFFRGVNWALIRSVKPPEVPADRQKIRASRAINMMPRLTKQEKDAPYQIPHHFDYF